MNDKRRQWSESCPLKGSQWIPIYCLFVFVMLAFLKHFSCLRSPTIISTHSQRLMNENPRKSPRLPPNSATRDSQEWRYSLKISQYPNIEAQRGLVPDFTLQRSCLERSKGQKLPLSVGWCLKTQSRHWWSRPRSHKWSIWPLKRPELVLCPFRSQSAFEDHRTHLSGITESKLQKSSKYWPVE